MSEKSKKLLIDYLPMACAAALIIVFAIRNEQTFFKTLPTLITLVVQLLNVRVSRFAFLLGSCNAAIYGLVFLSEGLYFSMISALVISFPLQMLSFFNWSKKRTAGNVTELRYLGLKRLVLVIFAVLAGWAITYFALAPFFSGAKMPAFDTLLFPLGIMITALSAMRYIDAQYINIVSCTLNIVMWALICMNEPGNVNYMIISAYNLFMIIKASISWTRRYYAVKAEK